MSIKTSTRPAVMVLAALALILPAGCGGQAAQAPQASVEETAPVPPEYLSLYDELDAKLTELDAELAGLEGGAGLSTLYSAELLEANANRGEDLLLPANPAACRTTIARLEEMGVDAITLSVNYPLLVPGFPRASEYLDFYRKVAAEVKGQGLKLIVETTTIFPKSAYSQLDVDYSKLTPERYMEEKRQMVQTVAAELRPDYLTVENEPSTQRQNTGLDFSVGFQTAAVAHILDGLDRTGMKVGAGAGTWDDLAYFRSLAQNTSLDYLDMHIYPIQGELVLDRAEDISAIARASGRGLTVSESWLYKSTQEELGSGVATNEEVFARDAFSFWAPLDQAYLGVMEELCAALGIEFYSPFWSKFFFGYLDYEDDMRNMTPADLVRLANREIWSNAQSGALTPTGETYRAICGE